MAKTAVVRRVLARMAATLRGFLGRDRAQDALVAARPGGTSHLWEIFGKSMVNLWKIWEIYGKSMDYPLVICHIAIILMTFYR